MPRPSNYASRTLLGVLSIGVSLASNGSVCVVLHLAHHSEFYSGSAVAM